MTEMLHLNYLLVTYRNCLQKIQIYSLLGQVTVSTQVTDLRAFLFHVTKISNFQCLTPPEALRGDCNYLCATLYACSVFGEHVLANLCLEKSADDLPVGGHIRIRAKTQGMAVTMGDKASYFCSLVSENRWF